MEKRKVCAVFKNEDDLYERWSGFCKSANHAMKIAEDNVLETYGSKSQKYKERLHGMFTVTEFTAKELRAT